MKTKFTADGAGRVTARFTDPLGQERIETYSPPGPLSPRRRGRNNPMRLADMKEKIDRASAKMKNGEYLSEVYLWSSSDSRASDTLAEFGYRIKIELDRAGEVIDGGPERFNPETKLWECASEAETKGEARRELVELEKIYEDFQRIILEAVEVEKDAWEYERECQSTYRDLNRRAGAGIR